MEVSRAIGTRQGSIMLNRFAPGTELIRWTKGFGAPNVEGHDVAAMFEKSLKKYVRPSPCSS
jgi:hypothetical protein